MLSTEPAGERAERRSQRQHKLVARWAVNISIWTQRPTTRNITSKDSRDITNLIVFFFVVRSDNNTGGADECRRAQGSIVLPSLVCQQTWGRYHGDRRPSSDDSFHSPTVIPPSALDKPSVMKRYHRRRIDEVRCDCTFADDGNTS